MPKHMHPAITTKRLLIRPRSRDDIDACLTMDRDPAVTRYIAGPWDDPDKHRAFLEARMARRFDYPLGYWSITFLDNPDHFLGWVMLLPTKTKAPLHEVEIGWRLTRATWGQGVATEATHCVIDLLRKHRPGADIIASIHADNTGSIKVAEKLGLTFDREDLINGVPEFTYSLRFQRA